MEQEGVKRKLPSFALGVKQLGFFLFVIAFFSALSPDTLYKKLFCPCGCRMILAECSCADTAAPLKQQIAQWFAEGKSEDEIVKLLVAQYGNTILATPPKGFFGSFSYVFPFFLLILGVLAVLRFLSTHSGSPSSEEESEVETAMEDGLIEEIKKRL